MASKTVDNPTGLPTSFFAQQIQILFILFFEKEGKGIPDP